MIRGEEIADKVLAFFEHTADAPLDAHPDTDAAFDRLALEVFAFQYESSGVYRAFCDRRARRPEDVSHWREIPAVPTSAFKSLDLGCGPPERTFRTSGTTQGADTRGRHHVPRLELYRRSALPHFRRMVLPDGAQPRLLALVGSPGALPDSSLAQMVEWIRTDVCDGDGEYLIDEAPFDPARAIDRIRSASADGRPLLLLGVRVAFTALLEYSRANDEPIELPPDSRVVETGGPKGGRALSDGGLLAACWHQLGIAGYYCVGEYGMTELCSQYYDDVLAERFAGTNRKRRKVGPAWLRTRVVDQETLEPLDDGQSGLLCHIDLANALSVLSVQTEDVGVIEGRRFELKGRTPGAEPRGCALALADVLASAS